MLWALLALASPAAAQAPAPDRIFVQQGVDAIGRKTVLMLHNDGAFASITSILITKGAQKGQLATDRGYWLHCGRWQTTAGQMVVQQKLAESFSYFPPENFKTWYTSTYAVTGAGEAQRLKAGDHEYVSAKVVPFWKGRSTGFRQICDAVRARG